MPHYSTWWRSQCYTLAAMCIWLGIAIYQQPGFSFSGLVGSAWAGAALMGINSLGMSELLRRLLSQQLSKSSAVMVFILLGLKTLLLGSLLLLLLYFFKLSLLGVILGVAIMLLVPLILTCATVLCKVRPDKTSMLG